ncbi:hypothetical protein BJG88_13085 [Staphylococcus nepalensis]|uniref:hypothetical protein n=1 Tax=Staphylococcus nepalensis TaxID=214473 RepID=UPI000D58ABF3|nr:hypothetical protein [Staphylococcus nepalensis]AWI45592.1 hypothetical protein BJG88_13085 [Staphylococcus nepalensis]
MKYLIIFIVVLLFSASWNVLSHKFLPSELTDHPDERQRKMFLAVLARTCVWSVYSLLFILIMRLLNVWDFNHSLFGNYPEITMIFIIFSLAIMNYFYIRRKYMSKGH